MYVGRAGDAFGVRLQAVAELPFDAHEATFAEFEAAGRTSSECDDVVGLGPRSLVAAAVHPGLGSNDVKLGALFGVLGEEPNRITF